MGLVAAIRAQQPALVTTAAVVPPDHSARLPVHDAARPVSATQLADAPQQPAHMAAAIAARLAERDESDHPAAKARAAAEEARRAYIHASRAAGISPLPLPGV